MNRAALHKMSLEDKYNRRFCVMVNGETETLHRYTYAGGRSYVMVDLSLTPELDTCKFEISGFLMLLVKLLRCQVIQR